MSSLQVTDQMSAAVAVAPRVTLADIEAAIATRIDVTGREAAHMRMIEPVPVGGAWPSGVLPALDVLTICILVLKNGFTIIGKSAPASRENFNAELGRTFAYEDAVRQLWPLMGFSLRDRMAVIPQAPPPPPSVK